MKNVLFAKYNRTRKKEYQICTAIYEEALQTKVEKRALCPDAVAHILSLEQKSALYAKVLKKVNVLLPTISDNVAVYEYIDGITLEEYIVEAINNIDAFIERINEANERIFDINESFINGENVTIANIDCLYDNFIIKDDKIYCMDCEWVFEKEIPLSFLKYRSIFYLYEKYEKYIRQRLSKEDFFLKFGFTQADMDKYYQMEDEYQHYVHGPHSEAVYTDKYKKPVMSIEELSDLEDNFGIANLKQMQAKDKDIEKLNELCHIKDNTISDKDKYISDLEAIINNISNDPFYKVAKAPKWAAKKVLGLFQKKNEKYEIIEFDKCENPLVSIIIPVYNQFEFTYNCLKSIKENTNDIPYEIIIADDCSKDRTRKLADYVKNINIIRNKNNLGFLKNCNNSAKSAKGKYIMFLNNDTTVTKNWLFYLCDLLEKRDDIGLSGSKLVYPNGILQECGGIIWQNGDGWNYGRNDMPYKPEYNYIRETDYISGASIIIRKSLWDKIGGFDERYAPAYYEDTDLCFAVRKEGFKVVIQPKSVVIHHEGVSNGTDTGSGIKKYQIENKEKFRKKWQKELENHFENPNGVFLGRERAGDKKIALFIDRYVPEYDKDAGSRSTLSYIKAFISLGYIVKFLPEDFKQSEPYASKLEDMGVEVLYSGWYKLNIDKWIKDYGKHIDIVFSNRPFTTAKYIDILKENVKGKIIYYGHDLHYAREMKEYELTHDEKIKKHAMQMKKIEYGIMQQADVVYYPSYMEIDEIKKENESINARAIPVFVYEEANNSPLIPAKKKNGIIFVGGFMHAPNADAVKWFVDEIFPLVLKKNPDMCFYVVGSNPPKEITDLSNNNIIIKGFVSDDELKELYESVRMAVVPLRFGAGMKGKVIEAIYNNLPVITTDIGIQGLVDYDEVIRVANEPKEMADIINELYLDTSKLDRMSKCAKGYIDRYFSLEAAIDILSE